MCGKWFKSVPSLRPYARIADRGKIPQTTSSGSSTSVSAEKFGVLSMTCDSLSGSDFEDGIPLAELLRSRFGTTPSVAVCFDKGPGLSKLTEKGPVSSGQGQHMSTSSNSSSGSAEHTRPVSSPPPP